MGKAKLIFGYSVVNVIAVLVALFMLPDMGAFKFSGALIVTEVVSKWYSLFIPIVAVIASGVIMLVEISENGLQGHKYRYLITFVASFLASCYTWVMLAIQTQGVSVGDKLSFPWAIVVLIPISAVLFASGYHQYTKKTLSGKFYSFSWLALSPIAWRKTHKLASFVNFLFGAYLLVVAILNECVIHNNVFVIVSTIISLLCVYFIPMLYSKIISSKYNN